MLYIINVLVCLLNLFHSTDGKGGSSASTKSFVEIELLGDSHVGSSLSLKCTFPKLSQPQALFWFKGSDIIFAKETVGWTSERVKASKEDFTVTKEHVLRFDSVVLDDDGIYKCMVRPKGGVEIDGEYTLAITPDTVTVMPQKTAYLHCEEDGYIEYPRILMWKKDKTIIAINRTIIDGSHRHYLQFSDLMIYNATSSDEGTYTCYNDGKRVHAYQVVIYKKPVPYLSPLRGWRGYLFGIAIGLLVIGSLAMACYIQKRPFKGLQVST